MSLQVKVKLNLNKERRYFHVEYNTYEKASFDQYLIASVYLHSKNQKEAFDYIDDITGNGSLNDFFKKRYDDIAKKDNESIKNILNNSLYPILKKEESQWFDYYAQLNISVFKNKHYQGNMIDQDWNALLMIQEPIVEKHIIPKKVFNNPEPYLVTIDEKEGIFIHIEDQKYKIDSTDFEFLVDLEPAGLTAFEGTIHQSASGNNWSMLTDAIFSDMVQNSMYFYDNDGNLCLIQKDGVDIVSIARMYGLLIYQEKRVSYNNNASLCKTVFEELKKNFNIPRMPESSLKAIIEQLPSIDIVNCINCIYSQIIDSMPSVNEVGVKLLQKGVKNNWSVCSLNHFLEKANKTEIQYIYQVNNTLNYSMDQLLFIPTSLLSEKHKDEVEQYGNEIKSIQKSINEIIGKVTSSGLRERAKKLKSNDITKRFSFLCNTLIGHVQKDLSKATLEESQDWLKDAKELEELANKVEKMLDNN